MDLSSVICMIVCVALNWGASALILRRIQKIEKKNIQEEVK